MWQLKSFVLETFHLNVAHTAENIAAELTRIANEWNVSEKVVALVTDNAANAIAAARITGWKHVPCFAHTLNLIVKAALESDRDLVVLKKKCKDVVTFFHHSAKASDKLSDIQKQLEIPENKRMLNEPGYELNLVPRLFTYARRFGKTLVAAGHVTL